MPNKRDVDLMLNSDVSAGIVARLTSPLFPFPS